MKTAQRSPVNSNGLIAALKADAQFKKALDLAKVALAKKKRLYTGIPYFSHQTTAASVLLELKASSDALVVCALHELPRVASVSTDKIAEDFGPAIATIVSAMIEPMDRSAAALQQYAASLSTLPAEMKTVKLASILDHICAVPSKKIKHAASFLADYKVMLPALEGGDAELHGRVSGVLRRAIA